MMDPKKYDELLQQEDHYGQKYNVQIFLELATDLNCNDPTGPQMHSAVMTVIGESFIANNSPVFKSDDNGAFYRQIDALVNVRIKLVEWLKEMNDKGIMSYEDEQAYITHGDLRHARSGILDNAGEYLDWLSRRRAEFLEMI
ncbi:hypothetical protein OCU04_005558 [Sclerotinia nivalis]|uniref:Uncharacterized protein n=1 Tax=Sclerotinia nivalis TaxID=352851 RepID=A0A9X0DKM9_9HELO|nr:hypothetical protein OCU04_005558 [Sclerotinia nivalis]